MEPPVLVSLAGNSNHIVHVIPCDEALQLVVGTRHKMPIQIWATIRRFRMEPQDTALLEIKGVCAPRDS